MSSHEPPVRPLNAVNRGRVVTAIYREPETADYVGNPLIEALPPVLTTEQAMCGLTYYPPYDEAQRHAPDHVRYHLIQNGLRFFAPLDIHLDLERRFSCLMRIGYTERNPVTKGFWGEQAARVASASQYGMLAPPRRQQWPSSAAGFNLVGMSGVGKSFSVERVLSLYPQVIHHSQYRGRNFTHSQITWLKLDCPFDANTKGLCIEFFNALDSLLGTNYRHNYAGRRRTQDELLSDMSLTASNHCLGVLVIDEIQRLSQARSGGAERMLNFFVQLINTIGVPVVLIGTYKALPLLSGEFSQMRRGTGQGDLIWDRMAEDEQWQLFVESLWRFQYTRQRRDLRDDAALSATLYDETQGITDLAVKLYLFAQQRAIESGKEGVTAAVIRSAARDKLRLPKPVLDALRRGDQRVLERFEDVYPGMLQISLAAPRTAVSLSPLSIAADHASPPPAEAGDAPAPSADQPVVLGQSVGSAPKGVAAVRPASRRKKEEKPEKKVKRLKTGAEFAPGLKAALAKWPKLTGYEALKQAGQLRHVSEYLERLEDGGAPRSPR